MQVCVNGYAFRRTMELKLGMGVGDGLTFESIFSKQPDQKVKGDPEIKLL